MCSKMVGKNAHLLKNALPVAHAHLLETVATSPSFCHTSTPKGVAPFFLRTLAQKKVSPDSASEFCTGNQLSGSGAIYPTKLHRPLVHTSSMRWHRSGASWRALPQKEVSRVVVRIHAPWRAHYLKKRCHVLLSEFMLLGVCIYSKRLHWSRVQVHSKRSRGFCVTYITQQGCHRFRVRILARPRHITQEYCGRART